MAIAAFGTWDGVTADQYDALQKSVNWENEPPPGVLLHVAAFDGQRLHVTDVWESQEQFQAFFDSRLKAGIVAVGIAGDPVIVVLPVHAMMTPGFTPN